MKLVHTSSHLKPDGEKRMPHTWEEKNPNQKTLQGSSARFHGSDGELELILVTFPLSLRPFCIFQVFWDVKYCFMKRKEEPIVMFKLKNFLKRGPVHGLLSLASSVIWMDAVSPALCWRSQVVGGSECIFRGGRWHDISKGWKPRCLVFWVSGPNSKGCVCLCTGVQDFPHRQAILWHQQGARGLPSCPRVRRAFFFFFFFFPFFVSKKKTYVCTEMAVAILLSRLAVTWLIVLKQLDEAIASLMAQLKYGQAEWVQLYALSPHSKISSKKMCF